jgi:hypothetical protein
MWRGPLNYNLFKRNHKIQQAGKVGFDISNGVRGFIKLNSPPGFGDISKVNEGDEATLQKGDIQIKVQIIKKNSDQTYIGQVLSVDPTAH